MWGYILCTLFGGTVGFFIAAILAAAKRGDEQSGIDQ